MGRASSGGAAAGLCIGRGGRATSQTLERGLTTPGELLETRERPPRVWVWRYLSGDRQVGGRSRRRRVGSPADLTIARGGSANARLRTVAGAAAISRACA